MGDGHAVDDEQKRVASDKHTTQKGGAENSGADSKNSNTFQESNIISNNFITCPSICVEGESS